jgi:8-oxo-dGTP diphosphatase
MNLIFTLEMNEEVKKIYGNHIRVRVCGVLIHENRVLSINHIGLNTDNIFWSLPGGGLQENETIESALKREFLEETGLKVEIVEFLDFRESIYQPLHAIELIFRVSAKNMPDLKLGKDPEHNAGNQILESYKWFTVNEIKLIDSKNIQKFLSEIKL